MGIKRRSAVLATLLLVPSLAFGLVAGYKTPRLFTVQGPTVIAFFPVTEAELKGDDANEALGDFQFYLQKLEEPLKKAGITVQQSYAESFQIQTGTTVRRFAPKDRQCGYYFIAPGKAPQFEYGVQTDSDLKDAVWKYFGITVQ